MKGTEEIINKKDREEIIKEMASTTAIYREFIIPYVEKDFAEAKKRYEETLKKAKARKDGK